MSIDDTPLEWPSLDADALERLQREDTKRLVREAVGTLAPHLIAVLVLREWVGLPYDEIATALDIPVGTVRSRLYNARAGILTQLETRQKEP